MQVFLVAAAAGSEQKQSSQQGDAIMPCTSADARLPRPRTDNRIPIVIFLALLVAAFSTILGFDGEPLHPPHQPFPSQMPRAASPHLAELSEVPGRPSTFAPRSSSTARYHSRFETSSSAGALGFWILISICGALLAAAMVPWLSERLRRTS